MEIAISHDSAIPLHKQLLNQLRQLILSDQWAPGSRLPSEPELKRSLNISRSTIRQALNKAEAEGLIERVPGKGTFVTLTPTGARRNRFLGYITFDFGSDCQLQLLNGAENAARAKGYRILFCHSNRDLNEENNLLDHLLEDNVRGILIWPALNDDPSRRLFQLAQPDTVPMVLMDRAIEGLACDYAISDNYAGAYAATKHLIELGHQKIAFLSQPSLQLRPLAERLNGYRQALQDAGLSPLAPWLIGVSDQDISSRYALRGYDYEEATSQESLQIVERLEASQRATAIFAMNDLLARQAFNAARLAGLNVPDDLSLVGYGDCEFADHLAVPLTTIVQDTLNLGKRAAELLIERIEGFEGPPRKEMLPTHLKVRNSTALPPSVDKTWKE